MSVQVYGCNHVAIEVGDNREGHRISVDVFGLEKREKGGESPDFLNWLKRPSGT